MTPSEWKAEQDTKRAKKIERIAKTMTVFILIGIPFVIGFFVAKSVYKTPVETTNAPSYIIPDGCGLAVVDCPNE